MEDKHSTQQPVGRWSQEGNQIYLETSEPGNTAVQNLWDTGKAVSEIYKDTGPPQGRSLSNKQSKFKPKRTRKRRNKAPVYGKQ